MKKGTLSEEEVIFLKEKYPIHGKKWCMHKMDRTESSVRTHAAKFGLKLDTQSEFFKEFQKRAAESKIGKKRPEHSRLMSQYSKEGKFPCFGGELSDEEKKRLSVRQKKYLQENEHPRGFLGHKRTEEQKIEISRVAKKMWSDPNHFLNSDEHKQNLSNKSSMHMAKRLTENPTSVYSRVKRGTIKVGDKEFFARSSWEANVAAYFQFLKENKEIKEWEHEPQTFWFLEIKRGVRSYLPDFKIIKNDGSSYFVEVKGWMDDKSKTKIKRFAKYYPELTLDIISEKRYKEISKSKSLFKYWGLLNG